MLLLPLRNSQHRGVRYDQNGDVAAHANSHQISQGLKTTMQSDFQRQRGDAMTATMPSTTSTTKRPKLSLQTANVSSLPAGQKSRTALNLTVVTQTPTYGNSYANAFNGPFKGVSCTSSDENPSQQSSPEDRSSPGSSNSSATTLTSCHTSPFSPAMPYCLPLGCRSILRNSPLPRRLVSASSTRTPKVFFPRTKKVCFRERLEEYIPIPLADETTNPSETQNWDSSEMRFEDEIAERKALDDLLEEEVTKPLVHGRRKRRREWIWRPLEDDISCLQDGDVPGVDELQAFPPHNLPTPELKQEQTVPEVPQSPLEYSEEPMMSESGSTTEHLLVTASPTAVGGPLTFLG